MEYYGNMEKSSVGSKRSKRIRIILIVLLSVVVFAGMFYFHVAVISPIIHKFYISAKVYRGLEVYNSEIYLQHEDGQTFKDYFTSLEFWDEGEVADFYFGDNRVHDSPIYGKACDVFGIDIQLDKNKYQEVFSAFVEDGRYDRDLEHYDNPWYANWSSDGYFFLAPDVLDKGKCGFAFAVNEEKCIIRVMMVTEVEDREYGWELRDIIRRESELILSGPRITEPTNATGDDLREP